MYKPWGVKESLLAKIFELSFGMATEALWWWGMGGTDGNFFTWVTRIKHGLYSTNIFNKKDLWLYMGNLKCLNKVTLAVNPVVFYVSWTYKYWMCNVFEYNAVETMQSC